ncbi:1248_t:CDS:1 [Paraglomus occultum]|uniref:1248_t:CDS:1 n=1 Tax=Paraglomus occultum TaxID=144539 RepID=A0A9N8VS61_9GLOM|nr:1248_t:CDS:1 [Paraglomus occultum]
MKKKKGKGRLDERIAVQKEDEYHHYIPQFLLMNFAINNYGRIFVGNDNIYKEKKHKQSFKNWNKKNALLQAYDNKNGQIINSPVRRTYGYMNMYKDLDNKDVMYVEKELSKLEEKASHMIKDIINASQTKNEIVLVRKNLENLRKFLFIMNYRSRSRWSQFADEKFDFMTRALLQKHMEEHKLKKAHEVWLQNIRGILETPHKNIKDDSRIFSVDRTDYQQRMVDCFLVIWQAGDNDEFIITSNGFGIFEGFSGILPFGQLPFQFAYHWFYVISPKLVLVLCNHMAEFVGSQFNRKSILANAPHPRPIPVYAPISESSHSTTGGTAFDDKFDEQLKRMGFERTENDNFTFSFAKISSETVSLVNCILLNETKPDLILTFLSPSYLYKTIVKYHKYMEIYVHDHDYTDLKKLLFKELNKTHEEDLNLRKNIPDGRINIWTVREINSRFQTDV